jgi:heptosyltransferase-2
LVDHSPYVDAVYAINFSQTRERRYRLFLVWNAWRLRWSSLLDWDFDLVLLPRRGPDYWGSELVGHVLAGGGALVVHREKQSFTSASLLQDEPLVSFVYSNPIIEHEALHNLHFLRWCGAAEATLPPLELSITALDHRFAAKTLDDRQAYVAFATGAGHPTRCWPIDRFATIAAWLRDSYGVGAILLGARGDPEFDGCLNLIGRTTLRQAAAVINRCALFIGNDSGLMHIAAAMDTPIVEISAFRLGGDPNHYNSPVRFSPFGVPHRVVQPAAGETTLAIEEITVDAVRFVCSELLMNKISRTSYTKPQID